MLCRSTLYSSVFTMRRSAIILGLLQSATATICASNCHFKPSTNATAANYPGSPEAPTFNASVVYPYDLNSLSAVPIADICTSKTGNHTEELACARKYIDAIDEQLSFLYARRLGYAAVAGDAKYATNTSLNDPTRNGVVAAGMAAKVLKYGGSAEAGTVLGGEGCMIFASLGYEVKKLEEDCNVTVTEEVERVCS